ncbi:hypothetical protein OIU77_024276 [Salix suchowensis]|uniref:Uncharacterized protein n=1 Tax=Salix suchowensis TaxID=1278906 RepID=A0ABQ9BUP9_9ROSI|nr:hypothetical protein OIU77_024276 [Salix suchowensis]
MPLDHKPISQTQINIHFQTKVQRQEVNSYWSR